MSTQANTVAILTAKPGMEREVETLLTELAKASRAEPGNLRWDIWGDRENPGRFVLDELYQNDEAVQAHRETPHFKAYLARIADLADRLSVVGHPLDVA